MSQINICANPTCGEKTTSKKYCRHCATPEARAKQDEQNAEIERERAEKKRKV